MPRLIWCSLIILSLLLVGFSLRAVAQGEGNPSSAAGTDTSALPPDLDADLLLQEPKTPTELLDTAFLMTRLGRFEQARGYMTKLLALELSFETWREIYEHTGSTAVLRMSRTESLQPESTQILEKVTAALQESRNDPVRINALIDQLGGPPEQQQIAQLELKNNSDVTLPYLVSRLGTNDGTLGSEVFTTTLILMGKRAVPAMMAALQSSNEQVQVTALEVLRFLKAKEAVPAILPLAYSANSPAGIQLLARETLQEWNVSNSIASEESKAEMAAAQLTELAHNNFKQTPQLNSKQVELWTWDVEKKTVQSRLVTPYERAQYEGLLQAHQALSISPNAPESQALMLGFMLAAERRNGDDTPHITGQGSAHDLALSLGPELVTRSLGQALEANYHQAAYATLQVLGEIGKAELLYELGSSITASLNSPDRAVQFAAAETILKFRPTEPFQNSHRVVPVLSETLLDDGHKQAVVVGAGVETTLMTANLFDQLQYDTIAVTTGREGFRQAAQNRGVQLVVLRPNTIRWPLSATIANLRADARTKMIPIVIYGPPEIRDVAETLASRYPGIDYVQETNDSITMRPVVESLAKNHKLHSAIHQVDQKKQQELAAYWLAQIGQFHSAELYDLRTAEAVLINSLTNPRLVGNALISLAHVGTYNAQSAIARQIYVPKREDRVRAEAARQLKLHIQKYGLLLTDREIVLLKQSRKDILAPEVSNGISSVMGQLKPDRVKTGQLLQKFTSERLGEVLR
ncbi:hypothetical protein Pla110_23750 [Polystyrenella longa]|uniref:Uncharacterized protein n=1 Tax=Polystyrenella longa TaxID=2528007 RepID=A0A518CN62_9PLAN|nr:hypothetical protein [Polystyrenella longa]QDU80643.1 hypothetical protein Pla110_23750 [Polystyrenella longa]